MGGGGDNVFFGGGDNVYSWGTNVLLLGIIENFRVWFFVAGGVLGICGSGVPVKGFENNLSFKNLSCASRFCMHGRGAVGNGSKQLPRGP